MEELRWALYISCLIKCMIKNISVARNNEISTKNILYICMQRNISYLLIMDHPSDIKSGSRIKSF